jgi:predicted HTH transcriptional regulator
MTETNRIEYKAKLTDTLEKEVVAFLNYKEGGVVYIGVDKNADTVGIEDCDETQLKIKDKLKHNIEPSCLGLFDVIVEERDNKNIIKIIVASGSETPYYVKKYGMSPKGCFIRLGSASEPMNTMMIEELFSRRTRNSLGKIKSNRQDLTFEQLKIYYEARGLKLNEQFASNLELLTRDGYYNYVAYLMADSNGTSIKVAKYNGINKVHLIENNEYGYCSLIKATKSVLDKLELENRTATLITSKERINQRLWNPLALKEAVINAIVHNDYTNELPPVFEIYDDRLEITSSGGLSVIKNKEKFFKGYSNPINREIMRIYKDLDMVEQLGSGMNRILSFYKKDIFIFDEDFLKMVFISNYDEIEGSQIGGQMGSQIGGQIVLTSRQQEIFNLIKENKNITQKELESYLKINRSAILKHINNLKEKGVLKRVGGTRGHWEVIDE